MNHHDINIGLIGGGNMARALVRGLLRGGHPAQRISIAEPDAAQRQLVAAIDPALLMDANNTPVAQNAAILVLAVKPQVLPEVAMALAGQRRPAGQLVMSVAAGVTLGSLAGWLGVTTPLVRVMPNQPATIGAGVSALAASAAVDASGREMAGYVAGTTGRALWLPDEALMDAVTAVSGSGPAYFYLLMEHMERTAADLGLPADLAAALVRETALGAARVVIETKVEPGSLRATVTSPGGTTAAALRVFEQADLAGIVQQALTAARDRSAELGKQRG
jgi:pyrroline-5-carboxylate reductase